MLRFLPKRKIKAELRKSGRSGVKTKPGAHKLTETHRQRSADAWKSTEIREICTWRLQLLQFKAVTPYCDDRVE